MVAAEILHHGMPRSQGLLIARKPWMPPVLQSPNQRKKANHDESSNINVSTVLQPTLSHGRRCDFTYSAGVCCSGAFGKLRNPLRSSFRSLDGPSHVSQIVGSCLLPGGIGYIIITELSDKVQLNVICACL